VFSAQNSHPSSLLFQLIAGKVWVCQSFDKTSFRWIVIVFFCCLFWVKLSRVVGTCFDFIVYLFRCECSSCVDLIEPNVLWGHQLNWGGQVNYLFFLFFWGGEFVKLLINRINKASRKVCSRNMSKMPID